MLNFSSTKNTCTTLTGYELTFSLSLYRSLMALACKLTTEYTIPPSKQKFRKHVTELTN